MTTCMFCGNELGQTSIAYQYLIPTGDDEEPARGTGKAHVNCIAEFESAHFDYEHVAQDVIAKWEQALLQ